MWDGVSPVPNASSRPARTVKPAEREGLPNKKNGGVVQKLVAGEKRNEGAANEDMERERGRLTSEKGGVLQKKTPHPANRLGAPGRGGVGRGDLQKKRKSEDGEPKDGRGNQVKDGVKRKGL